MILLSKAERQANLRHLRNEVFPGADIGEFWLTKVRPEGLRVTVSKPPEGEFCQVEFERMLIKEYGHPRRVYSCPKVAEMPILREEMRV